MGTSSDQVRNDQERDDIICLCHAIAKTRDDLLVSNFCHMIFMIF